MTPGRTFGLVALLALVGLGEGQSRADYVGNKYTDAATGQVLEYNIFVPTGYDPAKKYPLMVVLHAASNVEPPNRTLSSDGKGWAPTFISTPHQATDPSFFMIPISQTNASGWGEATQPIATAEKFEGRLTVTVLKQDVMTKYSIDPARLYITGPSMGGRGTWDIIRRYPGLFAAAAPAAAPASPADAAIYLNQNIWAICGEVDPIVQGERDTIVAIRKLGGNPIYTELAGHGHDSWRNAYPDPQFVPWMYAQRLGVPWWTVSKAPTGIQGATLTTGWPPTIPPANLPTGFGGASGSAGGSPGGGGNGVGGGSGMAGGRSGSAGQPGAAGGPGGAGQVGTGGATQSGGTSGTGGVGTSGGAASGGAPGLSATGGATASGGTGVGVGTATGGSTGTGGGGVQIAGDQSGGCSSGGRANPSSWAGLLVLLSVLRLRRRSARGGGVEPKATQTSARQGQWPRWFRD